MSLPAIDRQRSTERIRRDVETLAGRDFTLSSEAIRRYAYTDVYRATLDYFKHAWQELGFTVSEDPIGNLLARNRPPGVPVFGVGSHCDSNRNGGKWDGTLGVVGLESKQIGELAAERGHVLYQLRDVTASLEEAYFRLTGESVEYRAAVPVAS